MKCILTPKISSGKYFIKLLLSLELNIGNNKLIFSEINLLVPKS